MDVLLSLLLLTGFIFVIMRLAAGHEAPSGLDAPAGHLPEGVDPVCGRTVAAHEGFLVAHGGQEYRFCSLGCVETFERSPVAHSRRAA